MAVLTLQGKAIDWANPPKANALVQWSRVDMYGRKVIGSLRSIAHLDATNDKVKAKWGVNLVVIQPSYNTSVAASAGTHDYDACFDVYIPGVSWSEQQKFLRACGWGAYWRRPPKFGHHIHMFSLPVQKGVLRADDYREGGFRVGLFVDGGYSTKGRKTSSAQIDAYYNHRDALASNARDPSWFPSDIKTTIFNLAPYVKKRVPVKKSNPWFNGGFLNTHWNSLAGGKTANVKKTAPRFAKAAAAGFPALHGFSEVRSSQKKYLVAAMAKYGYKQVVYNEDNMLIVFARSQVEIIGSSFSLFSQQDGGNKEGVLRVKFRVAGSRAQMGFLHLDHDSPEWKKRSNLKEAYEAMKRYGQKTLLPDWKSRTILIGDLNDPDVAEDVLKPLGFKKMSGSSGVDQAYVGAKRLVREGQATKVAGTDHPRILVRMGKSI